MTAAANNCNPFGGSGRLRDAHCHGRYCARWRHDLATGNGVSTAAVITYWTLTTVMTGVML